METRFKEGDINEELIDKIFNFRGNIVVLVRRLTLQHSRWAFLRLLTDEGVQKGCHSLESVTHIL